MVQGLSLEQLGLFKASLREKYLEPAKSLAEAASRPWSKIHHRTYLFDQRLQKARQLEALTLQDLLSFYDEYLAPECSSERLLVTQVWGGRPGADEQQLLQLAQHADLNASLVTSGGLPAVKEAKCTF